MFICRRALHDFPSITGVMTKNWKLGRKRKFNEEFPFGSLKENEISASYERVN
jgi:hypothetical protein